MKKPKISPTELARFIALFDVDERVDNFVGRMGRIQDFDWRDSSVMGSRDYEHKRFVIPAGLGFEDNPFCFNLWVEV